MTVKDKAIQLVKRYTALNFEQKNGSIIVDIDNSKQCALIAVDEIIKVLDGISLEESGTTKIDYGQSYWQEVKNEIEKL